MKDSGSMEGSICCTPCAAAGGAMLCPLGLGLQTWVPGALQLQALSSPCKRRCALGRIESGLRAARAVYVRLERELASRPVCHRPLLSAAGRLCKPLQVRESSAACQRACSVHCISGARLAGHRRARPYHLRPSHPIFNHAMHCLPPHRLQKHEAATATAAACLQASARRPGSS